MNDFKSLWCPVGLFSISKLLSHKKKQRRSFPINYFRQKKHSLVRRLWCRWFILNKLLSQKNVMRRSAHLTPFKSLSFRLLARSRQTARRARVLPMSPTPVEHASNRDRSTQPDAQEPALTTPRWGAQQLEVASALRRRPPTTEGTSTENYMGQWQGDKRSGRGVVRCANGDVYVGEWAAGERSGSGACAFGCGDLYEGEWAEDRMHGTGALLQISGQLFTGNFRSGRPHGAGRCHYADGSIYEGEFSEGVRHGAGRLVLPSGAVYVGEWERDAREGRGTMTAADGTVYSGRWHDGRRHGQGWLLVGGVQQYEGQWVDGERCGYGEGVAPEPMLSLDGAHHLHTHHLHAPTHSSSSEEEVAGGLGAAPSASGPTSARYEGEWRGGKPDGRGRLLPAGAARGTEPLYVGAWVAGERTGHGVGRLARGGVYEGEWQHGEPHGFGVVQLRVRAEHHQKEVRDRV